MAITHPYSTNIADSNSHPPSKSTPNHNPNNQITLLPVTKADLPRIALLEHLAFEEDEFSDLAFGKERGSPAALKMRERQFEKFLDRAETGEEGELNILVIHPSYQRRGIGTLLLEQGLKLADEKSLQVVLGASPWGIGLYRKYGFVDVHCMDIELDRYEGGEGMGSTRHVIMRRPPGGRE
ncbi:GNAT family acetyltransferase [Botrytis cinerea]